MWETQYTLIVRHANHFINFIWWTSLTFRIRKMVKGSRRPILADCYENLRSSRWPYAPMQICWQVFPYFKSTVPLQTKRRYDTAHFKKLLQTLIIAFWPARLKKKQVNIFMIYHHMIYHVFSICGAHDGIMTFLDWRVDLVELMVLWCLYREIMTIFVSCDVY